MEKSESINELAAALAKAQGQMEGAKKDSENPYFKSKYADLAAVVKAIRGPFSDNGLLATKPRQFVSRSRRPGKDFYLEPAVSDDESGVTGIPLTA